MSLSNCPHHTIHSFTLLLIHLCCKVINNNNNNNNNNNIPSISVHATKRESKQNKDYDVINNLTGFIYRFLLLVS